MAGQTRRCGARRPRRRLGDPVASTARASAASIPQRSARHPEHYAALARSRARRVARRDRGLPSERLQIGRVCGQILPHGGDAINSCLQMGCGDREGCIASPLASGGRMTFTIASNLTYELTCEVPP